MRDSQGRVGAMQARGGSEYSYRQKRSRSHRLRQSSRKICVDCHGREEVAMLHGSASDTSVW